MVSKPVNLSIDPLERRFGVVDKKLAKCGRHGEYASIISSKSSQASGCPQCAEEQRIERDAEIQREMDAQHAKARLEKRLGDAMIPKRFQGKSFDDFHADTQQQKRNAKACRDYAENFRENYEAGRCLLLLGRPGNGKTHLATAIADYVVVNLGMSAVYRTVTGILQFVKGSYSNDSDYSEADAFAALVQPHLLVIDEAGATKQTDFELTTLFTVINGRYEQQKPTILISNLMPEELPNVIGERCVDRLREGGGTALKFDWESARRGTAA